MLILTKFDNGEMTTGAKRNYLMDQARQLGATYVANVDDDDLVAPNYIDIGLKTMEGDYDCAELWGQYYENNKMMNPFHHSIIHDHWWQDSKFYYRNPNHLNFIKLSLLDGIRYKDKTVGEDGHFSIDIQKAGVLKKEMPVKQILYYYFAGKNKNHALEPTWAERRGVGL